MKIRREDAEEANKFMEKEEAKRTEQINQWIKSLFNVY